MPEAEQLALRLVPLSESLLWTDVPFDMMEPDTDQGER